MFDYRRPTRIEEVTELLLAHEGRATVLAGGTDLVAQIRSGDRSPRLIIDLKHVQQLRPGIIASKEGIRIGALTLMSEIECDSSVRSSYPALADAAAAVGTVQIRNRATLGGNLCNASPAADTAPPLFVYGAVLHLFGRHGRRQMPIAEFFVGYRRTALWPGEIIEAIEVPAPPPRSGSAFERIARRRSVDLAIASVACLVEPGVRALIAMGAVAPVPLLVRDETGILADPQSTAEQRTARLKDLAATAQPISDVRAGLRYRAAMLEVLMARAHRRALAAVVNDV